MKAKSKKISCFLLFAINTVLTAAEPNHHAIDLRHIFSFACFVKLLDIFLFVADRSSYVCNLWCINIMIDGAAKNNLSVDVLTTECKFDNNYFRQTEKY
jgi:hypothetical protein